MATHTQFPRILVALVRRIMIHTGFICTMDIMYKHFLPTMEVYAIRDEERAKTGKMTTRVFIRITIQIHVHAHNESQFPNS